jgi:hypothetical protein
LPSLRAVDDRVFAVPIGVPDASGHRRGMSHLAISLSDPMRLYVMTFVFGLLSIAGWYFRRPK